MTDQMVSTTCALCGTDAHDQELYPANFKLADLSPEVFSARRVPDRVHYRMVTCRACGLVRSNPVLMADALARLYEQSHFTYSEESPWAARTYAGYFDTHLGSKDKTIRILEVGCGNGTFLQEMYQRGYGNISGIEPSGKAIQRAGPMQGFIHQGVLAPGLYPPAHFDVIAAFQVFDHFSQPGEFLNTCRAYLKPGGKLFMILHNSAAWSARILGRHSPIVDIEHSFLYNKATLKALLTAQKFNVQHLFTVRNQYPLKYWVKMVPGPKGIKNTILNLLCRTRIGQAPLTLNAGNMGVVAIPFPPRAR